MIAIRKGLRVFYPKLTIHTCITLEKLFGSVTAPIENRIPSLYDMVFLFSLCMQQYNLSEDELYELVDDIDNLYELILELYEEAGLINQDTEENVLEEQETTNKDELESQPQSSFEKMCNDMIVQCLSIGLSKEQFYNSTFKEVKQYSEAYQQQQKNRLEEQAFFDWQLANLIGSSVARLLSSNAKYPKLEEAYPFLKDTKPTDEVEEDNNGLTSEEMYTSALILEWAMSQQRKQEKKKQQEQKQEQETDKVEVD